MSNFFYLGSLDLGPWRAEVHLSHNAARLLGDASPRERWAACESWGDRLLRTGQFEARAVEASFYDDGLREVVQCVLRYPQAEPPMVEVYLGVAGDRADALRQSLRA